MYLNNTANQLLNKSYREFWTTIKKLQGHNKTVVNVVDDAFTEKDIVGIFCNKYTDLYNSVSDDSFNETVTKIDLLVNNKCNNGQCNTSLCHNVSEEIIKNAILNFKKW